MTNDAAVAWNVLEIGNRGAAYDLPWVKRAFTYDHQPGNVDAGRLGRAADRASQMSAGDSIDRGLALLRTLQDEGFGVFQVGSSVAQDATTVAELRDNAAKWKSLHDAMVLVHDVQERRIGRMTAQLEAAERRVAELLQAVRELQIAESDVRIHEAMNPRSRNYRLPIYEAQRQARERLSALTKESP